LCVRWNHTSFLRAPRAPPPPRFAQRRAEAQEAAGRGGGGGWRGGAGVVEAGMFAGEREDELPWQVAA